MADFTKTISNSLRLFGEGPATKWGQSNGVAYTMVWGTAFWGENYFTMVFSVQKLLENSQSVSTSLSFETRKTIENSTTVSAEISVGRLSNGIWDVVFTSDTTNAEERDFTTWTQGTNSSTSYTCQSAGSTIWS